MRRNLLLHSATFVWFFIVALGCGNGGDRTPRAASMVQRDTITICSFNIQFLGSFKKRDNTALADILKGYDIVVVQELVAPPVDGTYPNGDAYSAR